MKRVKRIIFLLILIVPIMIYAYQKSSYNDTINTVVNDYITTGKYANSHDKYIISDNNGINHLLKEDEFMMSILSKSDSSNKKSYLFDGSSFWLKGGTIVKSNGKVETSSGSNYIKVVEYVKPGIKVTGSGTVGDPWSFDPVYRVEVRANENGSTNGETIKYVTRGDTPTFKVIPNSGYRYVSNNCCNKNADGTDCYDENTKIITVPEVKGNTTCTLIFGTGRYEIKLNKATPSVIYANYKDNYYSDKAYKNPITKLTNVEPKTGYTFEGYEFNKTVNGTPIKILLVDRDRNIIRSTVKDISGNLELNPIYKIKNPGVPTINNESVTLVRGYQDTTLTCTENTSYDTDTSKYYQFGYASSTANWTSGNITWLGSASTTKTYTVDKNSHLGNRYYGCKVYAINNNDSSNKSEEKVSSTTKLVSLVQARVDLDLGGGTLSGSNPVYVRYGSATLYKERTGDITSTSIIPTRAGYTFLGWYTAASGGTKVIDANGTPVASVSGWTNSSKQFILTNTSDTANTKKLYAHFEDKTPPVATLTTTANLKATKQTLTLTCTDAAGVNRYYFGTDNPANTTVTYTTVTSTTSLSLTRDVTSRGTYYFQCEDINNNISDSKGRNFRTYTVNNMLQNTSGSTYTTTDYTQSSSNTYLIPNNTEVALADIYTIPNYSRSGRFQGCSSGTASTTAATPSKDNITISSNATYSMWFTRNVIYYRYQLQDGESLVNGTYDADVYSWSTNADRYVLRTRLSDNNQTINLNTKRYGLTTINLYNNAPTGYFNIIKSGKYPKKDEEWICASGCKSAMTFDQDEITVNYTNICEKDIKSNDCVIVLKANWATDNTKPVATLTVTGTENTTKSKIKFNIKCTDTVGVGGYYLGTDNPANKTVSYTPIAVTKDFTTTIEKNVSGTSVTYYLSCKDVAQNIANTSKTAKWERHGDCGTEKYDYYDCNNCPRTYCSSYNCTASVYATYDDCPFDCGPQECGQSGCKCNTTYSYVTLSCPSCSPYSCGQLCSNYGSGWSDNNIGVNDCQCKKATGVTASGTYYGRGKCTKTIGGQCCSATAYDASCGANSCWHTRNKECWH